VRRLDIFEMLQLPPIPPPPYALFFDNTLILLELGSIWCSEKRPCPSVALAKKRLRRAEATELENINIQRDTHPVKNSHLFWKLMNLS